jgi:hypothetical protein
VSKQGITRKYIISVELLASMIANRPSLEELAVWIAGETAAVYSNFSAETFIRRCDFALVHTLLEQANQFAATRKSGR